MFVAWPLPPSQRLPGGGGFWGKIFEGIWGALVCWYEETPFRKLPGCNACSKDASVMMTVTALIMVQSQVAKRWAAWRQTNSGASGLQRMHPGMLLQSTNKGISLLFSCRYPILEAHTKDYSRACWGGTSLEARGGIPGLWAAEEGRRTMATDGAEL